VTPPLTLYPQIPWGGAGGAWGCSLSMGSKNLYCCANWLKFSAFGDSRYEGSPYIWFVIVLTKFPNGNTLHLIIVIRSLGYVPYLGVTSVQMYALIILYVVFEMSIFTIHLSPGTLVPRFLPSLRRLGFGFGPTDFERRCSCDPIQSKVRSSCWGKRCRCRYPRPPSSFVGPQRTANLAPESEPCRARGRSQPRSRR
jgi:hypothetical protein